MIEPASFALMYTFLPALLKRNLSNRSPAPQPAIVSLWVGVDEHDVRRLEIAVNLPGVVDRGEGLGDSACHTQQGFTAQWTARVHDVVQCPALYVSRHDVGRVRLEVDVQELSDPGGCALAASRRLPAEAVCASRRHRRWTGEVA